MASYLLLQDGGKIILEQGGFLLLSTSSEVELLGGIMTNGKEWNYAKRSERKYEKQAIEIIEEALSSLRKREETPKSTFLNIKEKAEKNFYLQNALAETIPHDFAYITETQLEKILSDLTKRYLELRRKIQEEEIMLALLTY